MKVFLGGTMNGSGWRERLMENLEIDCFNPVVDEWTPEAIERENTQKKNCDYLLFVITPLMKGAYSIAEAVDASNKTPKKTIFCILDEDDGMKWSEFQKKSLNAVRDLIQSNGATIAGNLDEAASILNGENR